MTRKSIEVVVAEAVTAARALLARVDVMTDDELRELARITRPRCPERRLDASRRELRREILDEIERRKKAAPKVEEIKDAVRESIAKVGRRATKDLLEGGGLRW